ncbi:MAG: hypothetical protein AB1390_09120 [Nitrospirota bacterium]
MRKRKTYVEISWKIVFSSFILLLSWMLSASLARGETWVSGKAVTSDGKLATSGVVALEKGELHNNAFLVGGEIKPDGTFKIPLPSGGPWGLHVYSEKYFYFPHQIQVRENVNNEVPVIFLVDNKPEDNPRISNIAFKKITEKVIRISARVDDPDGNLGPQMLAIDKKRYKAYRMIHEKGDLKDKKANFPSGIYMSPFIPVVLEEENLRDWLFVVADHQCNTSSILNAKNQSIFRQPISSTEQLRCEIPGIWKSNFEKVYRFVPQSPGIYKGEEFEGGIIIDRIVQKKDRVTIDFRFEGKKGTATLSLICKDNSVIMKGTYTLPERTGEWVFEKMKN